MSNRKIIDYGICSAHGTQDLIKHIQDALANGYQPYGFAFTTQHGHESLIHQPVVKSIDPDAPQTCRECGCTDDNCQQCIDKTGHACFWYEVDLCSACAGIDKPIKRKNNKVRKNG